MDTSPSHEAFARLLAENHRRLFGFIRTLVPRRADADDLFQETCVVLWKEFPTFRAGSDFTPWALAIAFNRVRTYRHRVRRQRLLFADAVLEKLAEEEARQAPAQPARSAALEECMAKLHRQDQDLVTRYYESGAPVPELAALLRRPANTVYKALQRVRRALLDCIARAEAAP